MINHESGLLLQLVANIDGVWQKMPDGLKTFLSSFSTLFLHLIPFCIIS